VNFQSLVDRARVSLNDPDKVAYSDEDLMTHAEEAMFILHGRRPDLFIRSSVLSPPDSYDLTDEFPVSSIYAPAVVQYIIARAMTKDDEHSVQQRASAFFQLFSAQVAGRQA